MSRSLPLCIGLVLLATACGDTEPTLPGDLVFRGTEPADARRELIDGPPMSEWEIVNEWGSLAGDITFGIINDVAMSGDSILAVADRQTCTVTLIPVNGAEPWSHGGCGEGPDEFIDISHISFAQDLLWLVDLERLRIVAMDILSGEVAVEESFTSLFDLSEIGSFWGMVALEGKRVRVGLRRRVPREEGNRSLLATLDFNTTPTGIRLHPVYDPDVTYDTEFAVAPSIEVCGTPSGYWVAANEWAPQIVGGYGEDALEIDLSLGRREWQTPTIMQNNPARLIPSIPRPKIGCDDERIMVGYKRRLRIEGESTILHSRFVMLDAYGTVLFEEDAEAPYDGTAHAFTVGVVAGDKFVAYTNAFALYPVVRMYQIPEELMN